ncbi:hypothetical protein CCACVL1_13222 [Corchorus capsularis]|uniref:F-box domain-containing protein n=1 Tax=Corchorus capsularis TaxID=210143 RepID=A0A1R3IBR8_COCAP|nr:hypothetical protein CCACVL1_13222 [Corchorus capsularis]
MADWSQLPPELLTLITKRLETRLAVLRFRSVCSSWRSSIPPKLYPLPKFLPSKTKGRCEFSLSRITRNTIYLVRLPENQTSDHPGCCWLVKIRDGTHRVGMRLLNPLSDSELKPLPLNFPKVFDLTSFQVIELGHEFVARLDVYIDHPLEPQSRDYIRKVALIWSESDNGDFIMLALLRFWPVEDLAFLRSGEKDWTLLENVNDVQDIISFNAKFYAIQQDGKTIVIDQSLNVNSIEQFGSRNSRKFLVQSDDNLLAIEMIFLTNSDSDTDDPVFTCSACDNVAGFRIFRLNEEEKKWHEIESLGDKVLLLGLRQAISVSASELSWGKGNLVFYSIGKDRAMFVFDLENNSASRLENCPAYFNLFWPPPKWVISSTLPKEVECKASDLGVSSPESLTSSRETMSNSTSEISTRKLGGECNERRPSAGQEMGSKRPSQSSKFSFKFCCS